MQQYVKRCNWCDNILFYFSSNFTFVLLWQSTCRQYRLKYCAIFVFQMRVNVLNDYKEDWKQTQKEYRASAEQLSAE